MPSTNTNLQAVIIRSKAVRAVMRAMNFIFLCALFYLMTEAALAGSLEPPAAPDDDASAMYTIEDIYNRLDAGTEGAKRTGGFAEPESGPTAGTGHTLNEVMGKAPSVDDTDGAGADDVLSGKKFWGLTGGAWGPQTGTSAGGGGSDCSAAVAKTGQTESYETGDDGDLEKGVAWPEPRFEDNDNDTVTDNLTGLMWAKNANAAGVKSWASAITYCNDLSLDGYDDWRLPNRFEMESLLDMSRYSPALPLSHPFTGVQSNIYWSATTHANNTVNAWLVNMNNGRVYYGNKNYDYYVWPVRGGQ